MHASLALLLYIVSFIIVFIIIYRDIRTEYINYNDFSTIFACCFYGLLGPIILLLLVVRNIMVVFYSENKNV